MAQPASYETQTLGYLEALESDAPQPTQKFHGLARLPELHEDIEWTLEVPEDDLAYDGLVLLVPGLGCIKRHSRGERHANAAAGEASVSFAPARSSERPLEDIFSAPKLQARAADVVITDVQNRLRSDAAIPNRSQIDPYRITMSPHSMGGFAATTVSLWRSDEIEAVIYKASVGFGSPDWKALHQIRLGRTSLEIMDYLGSDQVKVTLRTIGKSVKYFLGNPARSLGEVAACLSHSMAEEVAALSEEGIPTAYLGFGRDGLVPVKAAEPAARKLVDIFEVIPEFGHLAPQRHPNETAAAVRDLRRRLTA